MKLHTFLVLSAVASACAPAPAAPTEPTELVPPRPSSDGAAPPETAAPQAPLPSALPSATSPSTAGTAPPPVPSTPTKPHARPAFESKCSTSKDCEAIMPGIPGSDLCCPGCEWTAANTSSLARFRADCSASPPEMCPPLGCASMPSHAECKAGRCVVVPNK